MSKFFYFLIYSVFICYILFTQDLLNKYEKTVDKVAGVNKILLESCGNTKIDDKEKSKY